jgi:hypothetical protein
MKKQSKESKKLLLKNADIEIDNIRHPKIYGEKDLFHHEDYDL